MTEQEKLELEAMMRAMARSLFTDYLIYEKSRKGNGEQSDDKPR